MEIFLDSADLREIKEIEKIGYIDGVLTNPSTLAKAGKDPVEQIRKICESTEGTVGVELVGENAEEMIREAKERMEIASNIMIKVPMGEAGLKAIKALKEEGIKTLMTLIFSPSQGLLAAKAGADYVLPFVGRLDNTGQRGMNLVEDLTKIFKTYDFKTKVLVVSIKHPLHIAEAVRAGASAVAAPFDVLRKMAEHPLTTEGIKTFSEDWRKLLEKL